MRGFLKLKEINLSWVIDWVIHLSKDSMRLMDLKRERPKN
jgi:hypothetical protein